jgi:hypothetical protein
LISSVPEDAPAALGSALLMSTFPLKIPCTSAEPALDRT